MTLSMQTAKWIHPLAPVSFWVNETKNKTKKNTLFYHFFFRFIFFKNFINCSFSVINFHIAFRCFSSRDCSHTCVIYRCINSSVHDFTWCDGPIFINLTKFKIEIMLSFFFSSKVYIWVWMANTSVCKWKHIRTKSVLIFSFGKFLYFDVVALMWLSHRVSHLLTAV